MTTPSYTYIKDIIGTIDVPDDGILTRPLVNTDKMKAVLFAFSEGQELSEHSVEMPATLHILQGSATLTLGDDTTDASAGTWVHMPPSLKHSVAAKTPLVMLLLMIKE